MLKRNKKICLTWQLKYNKMVKVMSYINQADCFTQPAPTGTHETGCQAEGWDD